MEVAVSSWCPSSRMTRFQCTCRGEEGGGGHQRLGHSSRICPRHVQCGCASSSCETEVWVAQEHHPYLLFCPYKLTPPLRYTPLHQRPASRCPPAILPYCAAPAVDPPV